MRYEREQLERIAAGDQTALKQLYDLYHPRLARFLLCYTGDPELVPEIINDVWFSVWQGACDFRGESSVSTWILSIAYRKGARALSRRHRTGPSHQSSGRQPGHAERVHQRHDLDSALATLSPEQRAVVELTYFFGYSYGEIGAILGCPENTVKTRMFDARRALGARLRAASDG
jgi:RNA polymerase sigma factor (sigma-70 family)